MTDAEYIARALAVEAEANARRAAAVSAFPVWFAPRRAARYRDVGRALQAYGAAPELARVDAWERAALDALDAELYAEEDDAACGSLSPTTPQSNATN